MRNIVRIIGVSLAAMAGSLMVAGVAWAQAEETPIRVHIYDCVVTDEPETRRWEDEDGILHVRDQLVSCSVRRGMVGTITGWRSFDLDSAAGHLFERAYAAFSGWVLDEMTTGVWRATAGGNRSDGVWTYTADHLVHLDGGGLVKMSGTREDWQRNIVSGTLLDPPGGESRQGPRPRRQ
jgi:hypothetical protein